MSARIQENKLLDIQTTVELILGGRVLVIWGEEALLKSLPSGNWIGGTLPYFYLKNEGGRMEEERVFVTDFTETIIDFKILTLNQETLSSVSSTAFENGFSFLILPAYSQIYYSFALNVKNYDNLYKNPLMGLVAGAKLDELQKGQLPKIFNGETMLTLENEAVVLHCALLPSRVSRLEIINIYEPSNDDYIEVFEDTFKVRDCLINGELTNLYQYLVDKQIPTIQPLICDYAGAKINVSFQLLLKDTQEVVFYGPLFKNRRYFFSKEIQSYHQAFLEKVRGIMDEETSIVFNSNSILNYMYGELDKNDIGFSGPAAFGEIAYYLLNQTFTYLAIDE